MIKLALAVSTLTVIGTIVFILQLPLRQILPKRNQNKSIKPNTL